MGKIFYSLFFMGLVLSNMAFSVDYRPLSDQEFKRCNSYFADIEGHPLFVSYCSSGEIPDAFIKDKVKGMSINVFRFIDTLSLKRKESRTNISLDIFEVTGDQLNDRRRFSAWHTMNPDSKPLWALYDPRAIEVSKSSIMITDQGKEWNDIILGHELSHYWFDRFGLEGSWGKDLESFAVDFETYMNEQDKK